MATHTYRDNLLSLAQDLGITDEEAGEQQWAAYLTDDQIADSILNLRPRTKIVAGNGPDREYGVLAGFANEMAIVQWDQGVTTACPVGAIEAA